MRNVAALVLLFARLDLTDGLISGVHREHRTPLQRLGSLHRCARCAAFTARDP